MRTAYISIDESFSFAAPRMKTTDLYRREMIIRADAFLKQLSPGRLKLLKALIAAMFVSYNGENRGYMFKGSVSVKEIVAKLGRKRPYPYDTQILNEFCEDKIVERHRRALPKTKAGGPRGAAFYYSIDPEWLYCFMWSLDRKNCEAIGTTMRQIMREEKLLDADKQAELEMMRAREKRRADGEQLKRFMRNQNPVIRFIDALFSGNPE
jgi:hypothetical protein